MNNNYAAMIVLATAEGDNFHLFADCASLATGRRNSVKFGRELSVEGNLTAEEAIDDGYFACRSCHRKAGLELPIEADRKAIRAERKAGRARTAAQVARAKKAAARKAVAVAKREATEAAREAANQAEQERVDAARKAALLMAIAAVYKSNDADKVRWNAAMGRSLTAA